MEQTTKTGEQIIVKYKPIYNFLQNTNSLVRKI